MSCKQRQREPWKDFSARLAAYNKANADLRATAIKRAKRTRRAKAIPEVSDHDYSMNS